MIGRSGVMPLKVIKEGGEIYIFYQSKRVNERSKEYIKQY